MNEHIAYAQSVVEEVGARFAGIPAMNGFWDHEREKIAAACDGESNPYLEAFLYVTEKSASLSWFSAREKMVRHYSWAVPNQAAVDALCAWAPLVELGAGTGYWSMLVRDKVGYDAVYAYDSEPVPNRYAGRHWTGVLNGGPEAVAAYPDRTLLLCWPAYDTQFADDCLRHYTGRRVVYVGEGEGGCTGDDAFHDRLGRDFELVGDVDIPQWFGIHDRVWLYERK